ncbi:FHA domain-containing protein [Frankia sp. Hr75.2]|nr:FHA domain-containing protein [Frankia sp. Hr75.2]
MNKVFLELSQGGQLLAIAVSRSPFTLGRDHGNDLAFPGDGTVSGRHAEIERRAEGWLIRDLDPARGVRVNRRTISAPQLLVSGDSIRVGRARLTFRADGSTDSQDVGPQPGKYLDVTEDMDAEFVPTVSSQAAPSTSKRAQPLPWWPLPQVPGQAAPESTAGPASAFDAASDWLQRLLQPGERAQPVDQQARRGNDKVRGVARGVSETDGVLRFRVERYDAMGNRMPPVEVNVDYYRHRTGRLSDGDEVEVSGRWKHGALIAKKVINASTGAEVQ